MPEIRSIAVIGAGAMGSFYASKFFEVDKDCISFVAGGERHGRLKEKGLIVNNKPYHFNVIAPESKTPSSDLVLVAVKHHQLDDAIRDISSRVGDNTLILSVMNGVDSEERIARAYGKEKVLYAVAVGIDAVRTENRVTYSQPGKLFFGQAENLPPAEPVRRIQRVLERALIPHEIPEDMVRILWWKFMINVGVNQVSALLDATYSVFQKSKTARDLMESAMREVMAVASAQDIRLTEKDIEDWNVVLLSLSPEGKTSMLQDIQAKRKTEVEMFAGKVIELGERLRIPTPVNQVLYRCIRVLEEKAEA